MCFMCKSRINLLDFLGYINLHFGKSIHTLVNMHVVVPQYIDLNLIIHTAGPILNCADIKSLIHVSSS